MIVFRKSPIGSSEEDISLHLVKFFKHFFAFWIIASVILLHLGRPRVLHCKLKSTWPLNTPDVNSEGCFLGGPHSNFHVNNKYLQLFGTIRHTHLIF